jgi:hypothetical protein
MVDAARRSGLRDIPEPVASGSSSLVRPSDGNIESTVPNGSEGARFIVDGTNSDGPPLLASDPSGPVQLVTWVDGAVATARLQEMLLDPATFDSE